eukprot:CAMPEP_0184446080 /NCGR_PEP_ID=MMETSP0740-20130409/2660_1 /TAXON_ID=385413 /ORGANISM="Thalassiosira miniscula, Strain CCMP1093" /LENGTH=67 /DNA_ID=CAMNT_0026815329 /DNA_START=20 /DNA_END=223 /DNA_ORIENTATION=-
MTQCRLCPLGALEAHSQGHPAQNDPKDQTQNLDPFVRPDVSQRGAKKRYAPTLQCKNEHEIDSGVKL